MERRAMRPDASGFFVGRIKPQALSAAIVTTADNAARYSPYVEIAA